MEWYYAIEKQQMGPVSAEQLADLVRQGVISGSTMVWHRGLASWTPYEKVMMATGAASSMPSGMPPLPGQANLPAPEVWAEQVKDQPAEIRVGECFAKGWEAFQANMLVSIGAVVLFFLANLAMGFIPIIGSIASIFLTGPLMAGLFYYFILMVRGKDCQIGTAFAGFGPQFVPLMLAGLLISFIGGLCALPFIAAIIGVVVSAGLLHTSPEDLQQAIQALSVGVIVGVIVLGLLMALVLMIVTTMLQFSYPLILDKRVDLMTAVKLSVKKCSKNIFSLALLMFLGWLLLCAGGMVCGVGMLFTMPWFLSAMAVAYEKLFPGDTARPLND